MKIYCLYDRKSNTYGTVFTSENNQTAQRYFQFLCSMPANELVRDDVELYALADYDPKTGNISDVHKDFVSNFVYDETYSNYLRRQGREELYQEMLKKDRDFDERMEVNTNEE